MADTIIKITEKTENFSIIINEVARRKDLSARAKGILLSYDIAKRLEAV